MSTKKRITVAGVLTLLAITPSAHSLEQQIETLMTAPLKLIPIDLTPWPPWPPWPPLPPPPSQLKQPVDIIIEPWPPLPPPPPPPPCQPWPICSLAGGAVPKCIAAASAAPAADGGAVALAATL